MDQPTKSTRPAITDSPWYWVYLFGTTGLIALFLMQPKFDSRQTEIERRFQGRMRAAQNQSGQEPITPMSTPGKTIISLRPLYIILAGILMVGWVALWWRHFRRREDFSISNHRKVEP